MSFVPAPQKATAANASAPNGAPPTGVTGVPPAAAGGAEGAPAEGVEDAFITSRTFDLYWVDKTALMYKDGYVKTYNRDEKRAIFAVKQKSSIPVILRDMAPPEGSIFDPARKWDEEKERRTKDAEAAEAEAAKAVEAARDAKKNKNKKGGGSGGGGGGKKQNAADAIKESNAEVKVKKDLERDLMKLSNLKTLKTLQDAACDTPLGRIHRMLKMLQLAVTALKEGTVGASEAEVLDILWALEEMSLFKSCEDEIAVEKAAKKEAKNEDKKSKKDSKKDKKGKDKSSKEKVVPLSSDAKAFKDLLKENGEKFKDTLKYSRKMMTSKKDIITFQLTHMPDRLPPPFPLQPPLQARGLAVRHPRGHRRAPLGRRLRPHLLRQDPPLHLHL